MKGWGLSLRLKAMFRFKEQLGSDKIYKKVMFGQSNEAFFSLEEIDL